jgi:hypothetical protein
LKSTDPPEQTLQLRPVGRIEGRIAVDQLELTRGMFVSIETTDADNVTDLRAATGVATVKVDDQGRFVIPEIAEGEVEIDTHSDERLPVRPRLPDRGELVLSAGETASLEIPLEMAVRVQGVVRDKDTGKPISGVTLSVRYGVIRQGDWAVTNENGEYSAPALSGPVYVHLISVPEGYIQLGSPSADRRTVPDDVKEYEWPPIEVVRSFEIAGKLIDADGKPMPNVRINGVQGNRRYGFGDTNDKGEFTLDRVPKEIQLEKFEIWTRDERFTGVAQTKAPLVVRLNK